MRALRRAGGRRPSLLLQFAVISLVLIAGAGIVLAVVFGWSALKPRTANTGDSGTAATETVPPGGEAEIPVVVEPDVLPDSPPPVVIEGDVGVLLMRANSYVREAIAPSDESSIVGRRLSSPPGDNAIEIYQQVLRLDENNVDARQGLARIADFYESKARAALERGSITGCNLLAESGLFADPDRATLIALRDKECVPQ